MNINYSTDNEIKTIPFEGIKPNELISKQPSIIQVRLTPYFVIETNDLEVKLKLCTSFIVKEVIALDPLARRQWLFTYKGIIQYANSNGSELTKEQIVGADIYRDLIKQVEELIKEEDFEGQNYNAYKSRDPDCETIYKKRLKQIREDFPIPDQFKDRTS